MAHGAKQTLVHDQTIREEENGQELSSNFIPKSQKQMYLTKENSLGERNYFSQELSKQEILCSPSLKHCRDMKNRDQEVDTHYNQKPFTKCVARMHFSIHNYALFLYPFVVLSLLPSFFPMHVLALTPSLFLSLLPSS